MEKKQFNISVFSEHQVGILTRITTIFTRRHINIESLNVSESEVKGVFRFTIVVNMTEDNVKKLVGQIDKQVDVIRAFYHTMDNVVYQELALFKVPTNAIHNGIKLESIIRGSNARILTVESDFMIIEKTGHKEETQQLLQKLEPYGILEFTRSGRVVITKPMKPFSEYMDELEAESKHIEVTLA